MMEHFVQMFEEILSEDFQSLKKDVEAGSVVIMPAKRVVEYMRAACETVYVNTKITCGCP